jgi:hypothetical protein
VPVFALLLLQLDYLRRLNRSNRPESVVQVRLVQTAMDTGGCSSNSSSGSGSSYSSSNSSGSKAGGRLQQPSASPPTSSSTKQRQVPEAVAYTMQCQRSTAHRLKQAALAFSAQPASGGVLCCASTYCDVPCPAVVLCCGILRYAVLGWAAP